MDSQQLQDQLKSNVFAPSDDAPETPEVKGHDFNTSNDLNEVFKSFATTGFQASHLSQAVDQIYQMLSWRLSDEPILPDDDEQDLSLRQNIMCGRFLAYTSNMISCGCREIIRYLVQHKLVDCIVTTGGGIEEDFIKCLAPTLMGDFHLSGDFLRKKGWNRIGNLIVPNDNYVQFEDWAIPILDEMLEQQQNEGIIWTPSKLIHKFGEKINNPESVYYWAWRNNIQVYCPGITDGSIGDILFYHNINKPGLILDIVQDIRAINSYSMGLKKSGMFIVGGGLPKHHTCNANLMRNGADYAVYLNTGIEHEGSDAGAPPDEAVSWGKIRVTAKPVKVWGEASMILPLIVSQSFVKYHLENNEDCEQCNR